MDYKAFTLTIEQNVAQIVINQAALGNPINTPFCEEFNQLSIECGENPDIKAVFIEAAGANFSLGGDLKEFTQEPSALPRKFKRMTAQLHMGVARFARNDAPVVIAAHNLVVGGAVALIAGADFVYASPKAQFYAAFSGVALCGDTGISHYLPRRVGSRKATEFMLLNQKWSAQQAAELGLINEVVEAGVLREHALAVARKLAAGPTEVYGRMRRLLLTSFDQSIDTQLEMEARAMVECAHEERSWKTMQALLQK